MKPIICPVCDCEEHYYTREVDPGKHSIKCVCCGASQVVSEQQLLDADPAFEAWCNARDDEVSERQNKEIEKCRK